MLSAGPRALVCQRPRGLEGLDVVGGEGLATNGPLAACDLLERESCRLAHALTVDLDHRFGGLDDLLLLLGCETPSMALRWMNDTGAPFRDALLLLT
jgi:hypothetical protein